MNYDEKLKDLCEIEGIDIDNEEEMALIVYDSTNPGICMNECCDYTTKVEPDQTRGWCECCNTNSVMSITALMFF